jgi:hypothetical protein
MVVFSRGWKYRSTAVVLQLRGERGAEARCERRGGKYRSAPAVLQLRGVRVVVCAKTYVERGLMSV